MISLSKKLLESLNENKGLKFDEIKQEGTYVGYHPHFESIEFKVLKIEGNEMAVLWYPKGEFDDTKKSIWSKLKGKPLTDIKDEEINMKGDEKYGKYRQYISFYKEKNGYPTYEGGGKVTFFPKSK